MSYSSFRFYFTRYFTLFLFFAVLILAILLRKEEKSKLFKYSFIFWLLTVILYIIFFITGSYECSWPLFGAPVVCSTLGTIASNCGSFVREHFNTISTFVLALELDILFKKGK